MSAGEYVAHVFDAGCHGGEFLKHAAGLAGHDGGERGFADAWRAEQDYGARRGETAFAGRIGEAAQRRALAQHLRLANHLVQSAWTHAHRQRPRHRLRRISRPKQIVLTHNVL